MAAYSKKLIIFDLDGTLTESKSPLDAEMAELVSRLISEKKVAIMSGGGYPQFETQFLSMIPGTSENYSNLFLLPTSGTRLMTWRGTWIEAYSEHLTAAEKARIMSAIDFALKSARYEKPARAFGDFIEDRGSQVTFSALGQKAPYEYKKTWDPDRKKREAIAEFIRQKLPDFDVRVGGSTSIDITKKGVNKGYGIRKLEQYLNIPADEILFVGDALFYGGNDYPAKASGVDCVQVNGPEDSKSLIRQILSAPAPSPIEPVTPITASSQVQNLQNPKISDTVVVN